MNNILKLMTANVTTMMVVMLATMFVGQRAHALGPSMTTLIVQGVLKDNTGAAISGTSVNLRFRVYQGATLLHDSGAEAAVTISNGFFSKQLTGFPNTAGFNATAAGAVTVNVSGSSVSGQALNVTMSESTVPTAYIAKEIVGNNTTDTALGGSIAAGKVVVLDSTSAKLPPVDGTNITAVSSAVLVGALPALNASALTNLNPANLASGSFPVGVSIPYAQITGSFPSTISVPVSQISGAISVSAGSFSGGALPTGVSVPVAQISGSITVSQLSTVSAVLPANISVIPAQISGTAALLPIAVSLNPLAISSGSLPSYVSVMPNSISGVVGWMPSFYSFPVATSTANALAVTNTNFQLLNGAVARFEFAGAVSGSNGTPTLNVSSTGAKGIVDPLKVAFTTAMFPMQTSGSTHYEATYDQPSDKFVIEQKVRMGTCTTASITLTTAEIGTFCQGIPAGAIAVICNPVVPQATAASVNGARPFAANTIRIRAAAAGTASVFNCVWFGL